MVEASHLEDSLPGRTGSSRPMDPAPACLPVPSTLHRSEYLKPSPLHPEVMELCGNDPCTFIVFLWS